MQKWQKLRVSRFTRNLHPEDHQEGLPKPGPIESSDRYEIYKVKKNNAGEWIGYNGEVNNWLVKKPFAAGGIVKGPSFPVREEGGEFVAPVENKEDAVQPEKPQTSVQGETRSRKSTKRKGKG